MIAYATVTGMIDDLHRNELGAEGKNVEVNLDALVQIQDFWQGHALAPPGFDFENWGVISLGGDGWNLRETISERDVLHIIYILYIKDFREE